MIQTGNAAPSSSIRFPTGLTSADNVLELGDSGQVEIRFQNSAGTSDLNDVSSTIQYVTVAAVNLNPSRVLITGSASWRIYDPTFTTARASGTVLPILDMAAIYSPYSTSSTVYEYTWSLGPPSDSLNAYTDSSQFTSDLRILRPGEWLQLIVTEECQGNVGDSIIWFFFRATEAAYASEASYPTDITSIPLADRVNLYYSNIRGGATKYWLPLHNSFDPYDSDINTGHVFNQQSWTRSSTTTAFSKANKAVHQKPVEDPEDPEDPTYSFHICGVKFNDINRNMAWDADTEPGIDGVWITLLGPDQSTKAEQYYTGIEMEHDNPVQSGESELRGSYCFNIWGLTPGLSYTFYIRIDEPPGKESTTPTLIGPITLTASEQGPRESLNNHFGNADLRPSAPTPRYVGGTFVPANKFTILAPYLALMGLFGTISIIYIIRRKR
jgi:hypothetical protein